MKLLSYQAPLLLGFPVEMASRYSLIRSGLRVGITGKYADITGNQGQGQGARVMRDELGMFPAPLSPGRGVSKLYKLVKRGKGKRAHLVRESISKRAPGRGRVLGRAARSVGVAGVDPELDCHSSLIDWLSPKVDPVDFLQDVNRLQSAGATVFLPSRGAVDIVKASRRAALLVEIESDQFIGKQLLAIGARAAKRQAERLQQLRGVRASATSIEESASAAVGGILASVRRLDKAPGRLWRGCGAVGCACNACQSHNRFVRVLALYGGRAAFASLASWSSVGTTGDNTQGAAALSGRSFVDEFTTAMADQLSVESWRADDQVWFAPGRAARCRAVA